MIRIGSASSGQLLAFARACPSERSRVDDSRNEFDTFSASVVSPARLSLSGEAILFRPRWERYMGFAGECEKTMIVKQTGKFGGVEEEEIPSYCGPRAECIVSG